MSTVVTPASPATRLRQAREARAQASKRRLAPRLSSPNILLAYLLAEIACAAALLFPSLAGERVIFRTASFALSLLFLAFLPATAAAPHPARGPATFALLIVALEVFHPTTNTVAAGVATVALNLAVLGPLFWVPRIRIDLITVRRLFLVFWAYQAASAATGVLQVYYPGRFQPALAVNIAGSESYIEALQITLANGEKILRPMGLTDSPGGAGIGGMYAVLLGSAFLLERPRFFFRTVLLAGIGVGCFALYVCQVRSLAVMIAISMASMLYAFVRQGRASRVFSVMAPVAVAAIVAFVLASSVGGDAVTGRLKTLFEGSADNVYYSNRGIFLEHTIYDLLPEYPFGAGLGRWGMMRSYFGDRHNTASPMIWAEIQWTGWLLDGGLPLIIAYSAAIFLALREALRIATRPPVDQTDLDLQKWAAVLVGYSVGVIAITFNSCPFVGTVGIDFWLINATIVTASRQLEAKLAPS